MEDKSLLFQNLINQLVRVESIQGYCYGYVQDVIGRSWVKLHTIVLGTDEEADLHKIKMEEYIPISQITAVCVDSPKLNKIRLSANYKNFEGKSPFEEINKSKKTRLPDELDLFFNNLDTFMTQLDQRLGAYKNNESEPTS